MPCNLDEHSAIQAINQCTVLVFSFKNWELRNIGIYLKFNSSLACKKPKPLPIPSSKQQNRMVHGLKLFTFPLRNFFPIVNSFGRLLRRNPNEEHSFAYVCALHTTKLTSVKNRANQKIRQNRKRTKGKNGVVFFGSSLPEKWNTRDFQQNKTKLKIPREHAIDI